MWLTNLAVKLFAVRYTRLRPKVTKMDSVYIQEGQTAVQRMCCKQPEYPHHTFNCLDESDLLDEYCILQSLITIRYSQQSQAFESFRSFSYNQNLSTTSQDVFPHIHHRHRSHAFNRVKSSADCHNTRSRRVLNLQLRPRSPSLLTFQSCRLVFCRV